MVRRAVLVHPQFLPAVAAGGALACQVASSAATPARAVDAGAVAPVAGEVGVG
jgi:hypothetical protein